MKIQLNGTWYDGIKHPNICPHCHMANSPKNCYNQKTNDTDGEDSQLQIWECANQDCLKLFVVVYKIIDGIPQIAKILNGQPKGPDWPTPILELLDGKTINNDIPQKSKFIKTYLQSLNAEKTGLDEIAGMGYRKSIEFLVKDWAIQINPEKKDHILGLWLGQTISDYYSGDLKDLLERASWLGNDQAHYNKLFEEYDITILKDLIDLIMVELDSIYKKKHYIESIQARKK